METKLVNGKVCKIIVCSDEAITNQEHFEHNLQQLVNNFTGILGRKEMTQFVQNVLDKTEWVHN